ncbi:hypothetical protein [Marinitoga lauensis]|nr:hypothetical protein [Marinitoga lauensis]
MSGFVSKLISKISFGTPKWEKYLKITGSVLLIVIGIIVILGQFNILQGV